MEFLLYMRWHKQTLTNQDFNESKSTLNYVIINSWLVND